MSIQLTCPLLYLHKSNERTDSMINRKTLIICLISMIISAGLLISSCFVDYPSFVVFFFYLLLIASAFSALLYLRCPHCGRYGLKGVNPFGKDAGYCAKCGKHVEFED